MTLLDKQNLIFFLAIPILITIIYFRLNKFQKLFSLFENEIEYKKYYIKEIIKSILLILSYIFIIFSLSNPSIGVKTTEDDRVGVDIVFLLDISNSMLGDDVKPSRLEMAITLLKTLSRELEQANFSLFVFKGDAKKIIPLTSDTSIISNTLSYINTDMYSSKGTNIQNAVDVALLDFDKNISNRKKTIILISDGGDDVVEFSNSKSNNMTHTNKNIQLVIVGVGGDKKIAIKKGENYIKDKLGNTVMTNLDRQNFSNLLKQFDSKYFSLQNDSDIIKIINYFSQKVAVKTKLEYITNYNIFLALGLILIMLYVLTKSINF